ncbi:MAG: hypothetical protein ACRD8O_23450 [Bryobacteraceae bacterium]
MISLFMGIRQEIGSWLEGRCSIGVLYTRSIAAVSVSKAVTQLWRGQP